MITGSVQLKVTLPLQLYDYVQAGAQKFGLTLSSYIKHLILTDVKDMELPTFKMSPKTEAIALKALKDYRAGKLKKVESIDELLNSL